MSRFLVEYGLRHVEEYQPFRSMSYVSSTHLVDVMAHIHRVTGISLETHHVETIHRETTGSFHMKWHMDDYVVVKRKNEDRVGTDHIILNEEYKLVPREIRVPEYSAILYLSESNVDFIGGELEFVNEMIIPKKHLLVFFHSREVHRVRSVKNGTRKIILFKFYSN
jgi:hypothetical protein